MEQKIVIVDSLNNLPDNPYKNITVDFEKSYAVKWYALLTYVGDELVGFMHAFRNPDNAGMWYFCDVHTKSEYRKKHIAARMYEKAIGLVKEYNKAYCIMASVHPSNAASHSLHEKFGFVDSHQKSVFGDFSFEPDETMHYYYFVSVYPSVNNEMVRKQIYPLWEKYLKDTRGNEHVESVEHAVAERLERAEKEETVFFDRIWAGDALIGFVYHSCDKNNAAKGLFERKEIMDFYILPEWRKEWGNMRVIDG